MPTLIKAADVKRRELEKRAAKVERSVRQPYRSTDPRVRFEDLFKKEPAQMK